VVPVLPFWSEDPPTPSPSFVPSVFLFLLASPLHPQGICFDLKDRTPPLFFPYPWTLSRVIPSPPLSFPFSPFAPCPRKDVIRTGTSFHVVPSNSPLFFSLLFGPALSLTLLLFCSPFDRANLRLHHELLGNSQFFASCITEWGSPLFLFFFFLPFPVSISPFGFVL